MQNAASTPLWDPNLRKPKSTLISRNITVNGKRTSMRLEPAMWEALS
jgi:predicted DNA-binding ribbon-helix-helix protein